MLIIQLILDDYFSNHREKAEQMTTQSLSKSRISNIKIDSLNSPISTG
jgi:hypothetical protein